VSTTFVGTTSSRRDTGLYSSSLSGPSGERIAVAGPGVVARSPTGGSGPSLRRFDRGEAVRSGRARLSGHGGMPRASHGADCMTRSYGGSTNDR
jgi:hypothetical protein